MSSDGLSAGFAAALGGFLIIIILIVVAAVVVELIGLYKIFKKAGKQGWEAIVPFYNTWVLCEISGVVKWFFYIIIGYAVCSMLKIPVITSIAALASLAVTFAINYNLAIKFEKDPVGYGIGLTFLPVVFYPILGFGSAKYTDAKVSEYGFVPESKVEEMKSKKTTDSKPAEETKSKPKADAKFCKNCGAELGDSKFCSSCGSENTQK